MWSARTAKSTILQVLFFLLIIIRSDLLAEIRWSVCISKSHRSLRVLFSKTGAGLCIYNLFVLSNLNFLHISQWITLTTQSCLVLYSFCANLLHSLIMWLMISSLSLHSLHLLFCCVLSFLALIWLVLMLLFCVIIIICSLQFFTLPLADGFHWSFSVIKSPQVSRTLLSILVVLNNGVVWIVSPRPPTSKSSSPFISPLVTVPKVPTTIGIIDTFMFHSFFQFPIKAEVLILLFTFFQFYSAVSQDSKVDSFANSPFLVGYY